LVPVRGFIVYFLNLWFNEINKNPKIMGKSKYLYREKFTGITNKKVLFLLKIIQFCSFLTRKCNNAIEDIQKDCSHEFYLSDQEEDHHGRYSRKYTCPKCSRESSGE